MGNDFPVPRDEQQTRILRRIFADCYVPLIPVEKRAEAEAALLANFADLEWRAIDRKTWNERLAVLEPFCTVASSQP